MAQGQTNNPLSLHNLYPHEGDRASTAQAGTENNPGNTNDPGSSSVAVHPTEATFASSLRDNPVYGWIGLVVLLLGGMWLATRFARGERPAANARLSIYNLIAIPILAICGGAIAKVGVQALANRGYKIPFGIGTIILAS